MKRTLLRPVALGGALAVAAGLCGPAGAAIQDRQLWFPASGVCDVNNPALDTSVRRRANEFRNIASGALTVTCGLVTDDYPTLGSMGQVAIWMTNNRAVSVSMACTLTAGTSVENQVTSKQIVTVAAGAPGAITWNSTHYGTSRQHGSISCALPSGWSIHAVSVIYTEDVGL